MKMKLSEINAQISSLTEEKMTLMKQLSDINTQITKLSRDKIAEIINKQSVSEYPYYKDNNSVLKVIYTGSRYIITKINPIYKGMVSVSLFDSQDLTFLRYYEAATELDWDNAITQVNAWLHSGDVKIEKL